jgi:hypothetical protein
MAVEAEAESEEVEAEEAKTRGCRPACCSAQ